ncbi:MBL fold metallo-hydrolase [Aureibaculum algae]|uniref:MBL fold metallo-hydrolase n=1 Tax=Aureibaculum algae TaxID=2584122 RepID=A0A5B7TQ07_9FLAO|nr:MBL fold metallo-hydrolase [Aureibaculum algae]QCX38855.1 MBL fold metallo-hydrolase [Aureibaculum algae]
MNKIILSCVFFVLSISFNFAQRIPADTIKTNDGTIIIQPITHGSFVLQWNNMTIYVDPYGGADLYKGIAVPDLILITDIHGDHTDVKTLADIDTKKATFIVPPAVAEMLKTDYESQLEIVKNGEMSVHGEIFINTIPMYNLPKEENSKHPKGRGNGYFINLGGKAIYISGDTEDIKEMRALKDIDIAFVCMNLPYTMDIKQAASAVLEFEPKIVYPYHYRGNPDMSDTQAFKKLVNDKNNKIEVRLRDWYKK